MTVPLIKTAILEKNVSWQANMKRAEPNVVVLPAKTVPPMKDAACTTFPSRVVCSDLLMICPSCQEDAERLNAHKTTC